MDSLAISCYPCSKNCAVMSVNPRPRHKCLNLLTMAVEP